MSAECGRVGTAWPPGDSSEQIEHPSLARGREVAGEYPALERTLQTINATTEKPKAMGAAAGR